MMRLAVEPYGTIIGALDGDVRTFDFTPSKEGVERFGANGLVLSVAIPLLPELRREHAVRHRNWFGELLPEGDQYGYMLQQGRLGAGDTLEKIEAIVKDEIPLEDAFPVLHEQNLGFVDKLRDGSSV
jgi:hypothetical protein